MSDLALKVGMRQFEDGIWRIRDIELAIYLGLSQPRDLRKRIKRDLAALEELGEIKRATVARLGGEADEFWLDRKQAVFIAARGETPKADEVLIMLVEHFYAVERGVFVPKQVTPETAVLEIGRNELIKRIDQLAAQQAHTDCKVDQIGTDVIQIKATTERIDDKVDKVLSKADEILTTQQHRRKKVKWKDEMRHQACVQLRWAGYCPCCHFVRIVYSEDGLRTSEFEIDHWFGRHKAALKDTWAVCHDCNMKLSDSAYKRSKYPEFQAYQNTMAAFQDPGPMFRDLYD